MTTLPGQLFLSSFQALSSPQISIVFRSFLLFLQSCCELILTAVPEEPKFLSLVPCAYCMPHAHSSVFEPSISSLQVRRSITDVHFTGDMPAAADSLAEPILADDSRLRLTFPNQPLGLAFASRSLKHGTPATAGGEPRG